MTDAQKWLVFGGVLVLGYLLFLLGPVLTPFLVAALLAYLFNPMVSSLQQFKFSRTWAVVVVFILLILLLALVLLLLIPMLEKQIVYFIKRLPDYIDWLQLTALPTVSGWLGIDTPDVDLQSIKDMLAEYWKQASGLAAKTLVSISKSGLAVALWLTNLVLIPVVLFYLLRDWNGLVNGIHALIPRRVEPTVVKLVQESDDVLGAFLRGQFLVMLSLAVIYTTGLWLVGLKLALLVGLIAGLVSFVPYLGFIIGILAASLAMLMQTGDVMQLIPVAIVFGVGQLAESFLLTPWLVGDRIGLHPVTVIFAVMAGGQLFGFVGVLLALPVAAVLAVLVRHALERYRHSHVYDPSTRA